MRLSFAGGTKLAQETVAFAGKPVICGGVVLSIVKVCVRLAELPHASVATYVREMVNRLTQLLAEITSFKCDIVTRALPPQPSVAKTCESFAAGTCELH